MKLIINSKTYGDVEIKLPKDIYNSLKGKKIYVEYNKSKRNYYACVSIKGKRVRLHRYIMNPPEDMVVDHIDGDTTNNLRNNLRVVTQTDNLRNRIDSLKLPPTRINKLNIRGLCKLYSVRDNRYYYRFKLKGYKTKTFALSKYQEAKEYAKHPIKKEDRSES